MKKQPLLIWVGALGLLSAALAGCTPSTPASSSKNTTTSSVASSSSGQSSSSSSSTSSSSSSIPDSSSSSIEVVEFDISFDLNGHGGDVAPATQKTEEGKIVAPENPTDDDYNFLGWTLPDSEDVLDLSTYVFTASVTLKAKWEKRALNVSLKANYAIGDTITLYNDRVAGAAIYKQGTDTDLAAENGVVTLNEEGVFDYRITRTNGEIETYSFSVEETTRLVHTFATAEEDANSFDFHITYGENGGTTWLHDFNGEYGVRTSVKQFSDFQFEVGNTPFAFDTIIARVYFETSEVTQVKIGSFWSVIADSLPTNQWVDLAINRKAIQTGGSGMYKLYGANQAGITDDSVFYNDVFGGIGYNNQQAFRFNILNTETGADLSAKVYLSSVRYMPADETPNLVHGFATASDESDAFDRHIAYGDGGTDWLESYKGEYGVRKTKKGYNEMQFELGATAFHFDSVKIRAYFEIDGVASLNLVSHYSHFADGIATNQWVDVTIARTAVQTSGSAMYAEFGANQAGLTDDSVFYSDVFGAIGNANQQAFRAVFYDAASNNIVTPIVYLDNVSYVPAAA
ncbi:MAG: InlB B-repeat-containing protein [Erysipelotrichaceae bacterium]|nr:InlB B-repeat-containing protein [Erysipelotrichaceae bacterium]